MLGSVYFYMPTVQRPSGGIIVMLDLIKEYIKEGYYVGIIYYPQYDIQENTGYYDMDLSWHEDTELIESLNMLPQLPIDNGGSMPPRFRRVPSQGGQEVDTKQVILAEHETTVIVPEGFPNIMEMLVSFKGEKIVLCQSWLYILNSLARGTQWSDYGFNKCIATSTMIARYVQRLFPHIDVTYRKVSINRELFYPVREKQRKILFSCWRGSANELITKTAIDYYIRTHPHNQYAFEELVHTSRVEYAQKMREASFVLFTDDVAGLGTMPLEAMACNTHVIGWKIPGGSEYQNGQSGYWVDNGDVLGLVRAIENAINDNELGLLRYENTQQLYELPIRGLND